MHGHAAQGAAIAPERPERPVVAVQVVFEHEVARERELCSIDAAVMPASVPGTGVSPVIDPPPVTAERAAGLAGYASSPSPLPDRAAPAIGELHRAIMRGRAAPAPLVEIGRLLITAEHEKPGTEEQTRSPGPRQASTLRGDHCHTPLAGWARVVKAGLPGKWAEDHLSHPY